MDDLLAQILHRHLRAIIRALGQIPVGAPNRARLHRAAYLAATRTPQGNPTEAHLLLIRDRHLLPPDQLEPLEAHRRAVDEILAGPHAMAALALLDVPELDAPAIEAALAALTQPPRQTRPRQQPAAQPLTQNHKAAPSTLPNLTAAKSPPMGPH